MNISLLIRLLIVSLLLWGCSRVLPEDPGTALADDPGIGFPELKQGTEAFSYMSYFHVVMGDTLVRAATDEHGLVCQDFRNFRSLPAAVPVQPCWPQDQSYTVSPVWYNSENREVLLSMGGDANTGYDYMVADFTNIEQPRRKAFFKIAKYYEIVGYYNGFLLLKVPYDISNDLKIFIYDINMLFGKEEKLYDITDQHVGTIASSPSAFNASLLVQNKYLYISDSYSGSESAALEVFDFSDPRNVQKLATVRGVSAQKMMLADSTLICWFNTAAVTLDISDPARPKPGMGIGWRVIYNISVHNGLMYSLSDFNTYLDITDVSDPYHWKPLRRIRANYGQQYSNMKFYFIGDNIVTNHGIYFTGNTP